MERCAWPEHEHLGDFDFDFDFEDEEDVEGIDDVALDATSLTALYQLTPGGAASVEELAAGFDHRMFSARRAVERVRYTQARRVLLPQRRGPARRATPRRAWIRRRARARSPGSRCRS